MRGAPSTTLSLPRRWSRKEQEHQVPLVILGASIADALSLFSQPCMPPSHFLCTSKVWEGGERRKKQRTELIITSLATNKNSKNVNTAYLFVPGTLLMLYIF